MCSGKTYYANEIIKKDSEYKKLSFSNKIKDIVSKLFDYDPKVKDMKLLQEIGKKMREIDQNIWAKFLIKESKKYSKVIVDDTRFLNEVKILKNNNFYIIKLEVSDNIRLERLKKTYSNWEDQCNLRNDISETTIDNIDNSYFNKIIKIN